MPSKTRELGAPNPELENSPMSAASGCPPARRPRVEPEHRENTQL
jgi:hypothetical protein